MNANIYSEKCIASIRRHLDKSGHKYITYPKFIFLCGKGFNSQEEYTLSNRGIVDGFTIPKQNGDQRVIYQASPELKSLQYWVREKILKLLPISEAAFAYQTGSSIKKHADFHKNAHFIFHTDIKNYFPSIHEEMLTDILIEHRDSLQAQGMWFEDICDVVAKICFRNGQLSIGTVSSPMISNIVAYKFEHDI